MLSQKKSRLFRIAIWDFLSGYPAPDKCRPLQPLDRNRWALYPTPDRKALAPPGIVEACRKSMPLEGVAPYYVGPRPALARNSQRLHPNVPRVGQLGRGRMARRYCQVTFCGRE